MIATKSRAMGSGKSMATIGIIIVELPNPAKVPIKLAIKVRADNQKTCII